MSEKRELRVYWRKNSRGQKRAYGDFRDYGDVGGGREALIPEGARTPTMDADVATDLVTKRVKELEKAGRSKSLLGITREAALEEYASEHLVRKAKAEEVREKTLSTAERHLRRAVGFFGADRNIASLRPRDVEAWSAKLRETLSASTVCHHLNDLSNMYETALRDDLVTRNPVAAIKKPKSRSEEARWLGVDDAALLLEAARLYEPPQSANPYIFEILATMLLTGGRKAEVLGLEVDDVNLTRKTVTFRPNDWRPLKTRRSDRVVPLWPQLEEVLRAYLLRREREAPLGLLLFPSPKSTPEREMHVRRSPQGAQFDQRPGRMEGRRAYHEVVPPHLLRRPPPESRSWTARRGVDRVA